MKMFTFKVEEVFILGAFACYLHSTLDLLLIFVSWLRIVLGSRFVFWCTCKLVLFFAPDDARHPSKSDVFSDLGLPEVVVSPLKLIEVGKQFLIILGLKYLLDLTQPLHLEFLLVPRILLVKTRIQDARDGTCTRLCVITVAVLAAGDLLNDVLFVGIDRVPLIAVSAIEGPRP